MSQTKVSLAMLKQEVLDAFTPQTSILIAGEGIDYTGAEDSSEAIHAIIASAIDAGIYRAEIGAGTLKCNLVIPPNFSIRGAGSALGADIAWVPGTAHANAITILKPADDDEPVILIPELKGSKISDLDITGNGNGVSDAGLAVENGFDNYPGMGLRMESVRVSGFTDNIRLDRPNGCTFIDVTSVYCGTCWKGIGLSDTWQLINCHGNYYTVAAMDVELPRGIKVSGGDWGNASAPLLTAFAGGGVVWEDTNVESVNYPYFFGTTNSDLTIRGNRFSFNSLPSAAVVRQTSLGVVTIENNRHDEASAFGTFGIALMWETNDAAVSQPNIVGRPGVCRLTDAGFTTTTRAWRPDKISAFAYKTTFQTGLASGVNTTVTFEVEAWDHSQALNHATGVFTAPVAGSYAMDFTLMLNTANGAGYSRAVELVGGAAAAAITRQNCPQYDGITGTFRRDLLAGQTWALAFTHDLGSDMSLYGSVAGSECWISITKVSE